MNHPKSYFDREVKLHTPEQMFARLAEISRKIGFPGGSVVSAAGQQTATADGGASTVSSTARSSPRDRQPLQWQDPVVTPDGGYIRSVCERYTVTKSRSMGKWVYTASCGRSPLPGAVQSADEAKQIAQRHANG